MKEGLPKVRDDLSGIQAVFRDGEKVLVLQGAVQDEVYLNINGKDIIVEADKLLEAINRVVKGRKRNED